ncbi:MAG: FlgO family outer membrane protein [Desulfosoma sp.]
MRRLSVLCVVLGIAVAAAGCACQRPCGTSVGAFGPVEAGGNVVSAAYRIADAMAGNLRDPVGPDRTILVATFVDVNDLTKSSPFGRIFGEHVASRLAQKGYRVMELKLRQNSIFMENTKGEFLLSRDVKDVSTTHNAWAVVVGTYAASSDRAYVSARMVRAADGVVIGASDGAVLMSPRALAAMIPWE